MTKYKNISRKCNMDPITAHPSERFTHASLHREFFFQILLQIIIPAITQSVNFLTYAVTANRTRYSSSILLFLSLFFIRLTYRDLNAPSSGSTPSETQWELLWKPWANLSAIPIYIHQSSADRSWYYNIIHELLYPLLGLLFRLFNSISKSLFFSSF